MDEKTLQAIEDAVTRAIGTPRAERLLDAREVADWLSVSRSMAYKLMSTGEFRTVRVGKAVRVREADLTAYIEAPRLTSALTPG